MRNIIFDFGNVLVQWHPEQIYTAHFGDEAKAWWFMRHVTDATWRNRSLKVGLLSVGASFIQLFGYGSGFIAAWWRRCVRGKDEFNAFEKTFYD